MGAGVKTYIILCILFFISSEALVSNALKPSQTQHVVQHVIGKTERFTFFLCTQKQSIF